MIEPPKLVWNAADWLAITGALAAVLLVLLVGGYWRAGASRGVRVIAGTLKGVGIFILLICLLEPMFSGQRAKPGANQFAVMADNSQSMTLKDLAAKTRGEQLQALAAEKDGWLSKLGRDFELRQFAFDSQLRTVEGLDTLTFDGHASDLGANLDRLVRRYEGRPLAGVLLFTDGSATDTQEIDRVLARAASPDAHIPPIYPVLIGKKTSGDDISLQRVQVTQTNFEDAPVTIAADMAATGRRGQPIQAILVDESGKTVETQTVQVEKEGEPIAVRFRVKPETAGISFYTVRVGAAEQPGQTPTPEVTMVNNTRMVAVDRGKGPYRVLYVTGRPNWEYKFLKRSVQGDDQVQLVGLIRVAKREPKFNFIGRAGDNANPLFRGFENKDRESAENFDQPVLIRMDTRDQDELRGGFPKSADDLFGYHAIVIDDLEAEFFSQDQMQLIKDFVRQRGGGLLMLGGLETFHNGKYDRTPIGDLLPVYADQVPEATAEDQQFRLSLTREGWLEPWLRLNPEEAADRQRLEAMPAFETLNPIRGIKPGATILARALAADGTAFPALVEQRFGQGRVGALLIGDLWRWEMHRPVDTDTDMEKAWRQTIRWLVADVPQRVEAAVAERTDSGDAQGSLAIGVQVRDPAYAPLDNAVVSVRITGPDGKFVDMRAEPSPKTPGKYEAFYVPRLPGAYRTKITAAAPDGSDAGETQASWTSDPAAEEFKQLQPNTALLERIAQATGGEVIDAGKLDAFVASLPTRKAQITETYVQPFWHQSWVFLLAIGCLAAEWGLRRWKGLP